MDCGICLEALGCASYVAPAAESETLPDTAVRFPCGHAFHSSCAVHALLTSRTCPSCRANLDPNYAASEADTEVEHLFQAAPLVDETMAHDPRMHRIRSRSAAIQLERRNFRLQLRDFNRLQDRMRHRRRQVVQDALGALRRRYYASCIQAMGRLQESLERVHDLEIEAWTDDTGELPTGPQWQQYLSRDASEYIGQSRTRCESLLDRRFWSLR